MPPVSEPQVTILVLHWNYYDLTVDCLRFLQFVNYTNYKTIVIDNGSTNDSLQRLQQAFPHLTYLLNPANLGFSAGNNRGIHFALQNGADYILLLNNDTQVDPNFLRPLVDDLEQNPMAGIACPKIYFAQPSDVLWCAGVNVNLNHPAQLVPRGGSKNLSALLFEMRGLGHKDIGQFDCPEWVESATGCALLISRSVIETIGFFDEELFLIHEDSDWCWRATQKGYKIRYVPQSVLWHHVSATTTQQGVADQTYYATRNALRFIQKFAPPWVRYSLYLLSAFILGRDLLRWLIFPTTRPLSAAKIQAVRDFVRGRWGKRP